MAPCRRSFRIPTSRRPPSRSTLDGWGSNASKPSSACAPTSCRGTDGAIIRRRRCGSATTRPSRRTRSRSVACGWRRDTRTRSPARWSPSSAPSRGRNRAPRRGRAAVVARRRGVPHVAPFGARPERPGLVPAAVPRRPGRSPLRVAIARTAGTMMQHRSSYSNPMARPTSVTTARTTPNAAIMVPIATGMRPLGLPDREAR